MLKAQVLMNSSKVLIEECYRNRGIILLECVTIRHRKQVPSKLRIRHRIDLLASYLMTVAEDLQRRFAGAEEFEV